MKHLPPLDELEDFIETQMFLHSLRHQTSDKLPDPEWTIGFFQGLQTVQKKIAELKREKRGL